jgi:hypothetical protein
VLSEDYAPCSVAEVTMTTTSFVDSASVIVTVINFSAGGQQIGTDTVGFDGPFAGGQVFTQQGTADGSNASCEISNVESTGNLSYANDSPVS